MKDIGEELRGLDMSENNSRKLHIASFSGGKDSTATVILAHEHKEPLDIILFSEVMFDENTTGEVPEHIDFIKNKCIPLFESWGYEVKVLHSPQTYMSCFNHVVKKARKNKEHEGMKKGFVMPGHCDVQRDCKLKPIKDFLAQYTTGEYTQYIGIAVDEPKRLERLIGTNKISLLQKYGYTEKKAYQKCEEYGLLSPIYSFAPRGGVLVLSQCKRRRATAFKEKS